MMMIMMTTVMNKNVYTSYPTSFSSAADNSEYIFLFSTQTDRNRKQHEQATAPFVLPVKIGHTDCTLVELIAFQFDSSAKLQQRTAVNFLVPIFKLKIDN